MMAGRRFAGSRARIRDWLSALAVMGGAAAVAVALNHMGVDRISGTAIVSDGDSLLLEGTRVRLRGIDAPERAQTCLDLDVEHPCGVLAMRHLDNLIAGQTVSCAITDADRYGRLLGVCRTGQSSQTVLLNQIMVADGWAVAYGDYRAEEKRARADRIGMWAWTFDRPESWRRQQRLGEASISPVKHVSGLWRQLRGWFGFGGHNE